MSQVKKGLKKIRASEAYYIKLGSNGAFEESCIEKEGTIRLSYTEFDHKACLAGDWDKVWASCRVHSKSDGAATNHLNQLKFFYSSSSDTIWYTFYKGKLFWCFTETKIELLKDGTKIKKCTRKWSDKDINGKELLISSLSGKLTRTRGYRQTICPCKVKEYLMDRVNGIVPPFVAEASDALMALEISIENLISELSPKDFELLVEMVFLNTGWIRIGGVGGQEKDIDLELVSPVTGDRVVVQIKSKASTSIVREYLKRIEAWNVNQLFFVYHTGVVSLQSLGQDDSYLKLVDSKRLSRLVISAGLTNWIIERSA